MEKKGRRKVENPPVDSTVMIANTMTMAKKKDIPVICQRIRHFREKRGMEQKELAGNLGIHPNAVSNWEGGRARPDIALLPGICRELGITFYELFDVPAPSDKLSAEEERVLGKFRRLSLSYRYVTECGMDKLLEIQEIRECPDLIVLTQYSKQLAAGFDPGEEFDDKGEPVYLYRTPDAEKADCVFTVSGDSMEPEFHDGDRVLVQRFPQCGDFMPGEVGAFITRNETYIKAYQPDGLHSYNPKYKPMHFTDDERVFAIGKVIARLEPDDVASFEDCVLYDKLHGRP